MTEALLALSLALVRALALVPSLGLDLALGSPLDPARAHAHRRGAGAGAGAEAEARARVDCAPSRAQGRVADPSQGAKAQFEAEACLGPGLDLLRGQSRGPLQDPSRGLGRGLGRSQGRSRGLRVARLEAMKRSVSQQITMREGGAESCGGVGLDAG